MFSGAHRSQPPWCETLHGGYYRCPWSFAWEIQQTCRQCTFNTTAAAGLKSVFRESTCCFIFSPNKWRIMEIIKSVERLWCCSPEWFHICEFCNGSKKNICFLSPLRTLSLFKFWGLWMYFSDSYWSGQSVHFVQVILLPQLVLLGGLPLDSFWLANSNFPQS